jgi:hypothetical protein
LLPEYYICEEKEIFLSTTLFSEVAPEKNEFGEVVVSLRIMLIEQLHELKKPALEIVLPFPDELAAVENTIAAIIER